MIELEGYEIIQELATSVKVNTYRGIRKKDHVPVILKVLNAEYPNPEDIASLKHEYDLIKKIDTPSVVHAYALEHQGSRYELILEDIPQGITLREMLASQKISITKFLSLAIDLAEALHVLHSMHIVHKDINPNNIIVTTNESKVKLIDFSIATQLLQEVLEVKTPDMLEGTLPYISPEQTGRMNKIVDERTDLYSLGVTFYEMLTHRLPFRAKDAIEWVHCHIAVIPKSPHEIRPDIPKMISDIIMKLLSKSPENRYATAYGLKLDLERCLSEWQRNNEIKTFLLGERDYNFVFHIPQKLYGREKELVGLMDAFNRISKGGRELLLVSGYPGIGKSSLVNEIHKPIVKEHGYFAAGKFEEFKQKIPYAALIQAFKKLIQQILTEKRERIEAWRIQLLKALGNSGRVMTEVIPELEWLIGQQPPIAELPPSEARNRFELILFDFVRVFAKEEHPLVIFLDDLQWADYTSCDLLAQLLRDNDLHYFLVIGSYRGNEVTLGHPLLEMIERLNKEKVNVNIEKIPLTPLSFKDVYALLNDTLHAKIELNAFAKLVIEKTGGNPFFINTFLTSLVQDKYLAFDNSKGEWTWDINTLKSLKVTDNVVDLIISKMIKLPAKTQALLKVAACCGHQFDLTTLSLFMDISIANVATILWPALQENFIISIDNDYQLAMADNDFAINKQHIYCRFSHDRVQHAAYTTLSIQERKEIDLKLGRLLLEKTSEKEKPEKLFEIVNHFNASLDLITDPEERFKIATLNLEAGRKAKFSVAYSPAAKFYECGIKLLGENEWSNDYNLAFDMHMGLAECAYLLGQFERADEECTIIVEHARNKLDKARVAMLQTLCYTTQAKYDRAIKSGLGGLEVLGIKLPASPSKFTVFKDFLKVAFLLRKREIADLLKLPPLTDPEKKLILTFFERLSPPSYLTNINLYTLLALRGIRYCLTHGYTTASATQFCFYGIALMVSFHDYAKSYQMGKICIELVKESNDLRIKVMVYFMVGTLLYPWKLPYEECLPYLNQVFILGPQAGELLYTNYAAGMIPQMLFAQGKELEEIRLCLKKMFVVVEFTNNRDNLANLIIMERVVLVLNGEKPFAYLEDKINELIHHALGASSTLYGITAIWSLATTYILGEFDIIRRILPLTKFYAFSQYIAPIFVMTEYLFYASLSLIKFYPTANLLEKRRYLREIKANLTYLKKFSSNCPENFYARYLLVQVAVKGYIKKNIAEAYNNYDLAMQFAKRYNQIHLLGIGNELMARIYTFSGQSKSAIPYLFDAVYAYQQWGALKKVDLLKIEFPELNTIKSLTLIEDIPIMNVDKQSFTKSINTKQTLDLESIIKSARVISSHVKLNGLLRTLMKVVLENAGANRGFVLLLRNEELLIEAEKSETEKIKTLGHEPADSRQDLSLTIIQYVQRTHHPVLIDNAALQDEFADDLYLYDKKSLSILCMPILHQGKLLGILYLENTLTQGAFTNERLKVLKLLASQTAVSLENALLYSAYDQFVPHEFLELLDRRSIVDIQLGDHVQKYMTILFSDIRHFTKLSEQMNPAEIFNFMNEYLGHMEPIIKNHGGFIDKYIGDAIMAVFPNEPSDAVNAAIAMQEKLREYNAEREKNGNMPIQIGIGINSGNLMLGTLGSSHHLETSVLSDAVNVASRLENLTKQYGSEVLISEETYSRLLPEQQAESRFVDERFIRGKKKSTKIWEIFLGEPQEIRYMKQAIASHYKLGIELFYQKKYEEALQYFKRCQTKIPNDEVIKLYISKCESFKK